MGMTIEDAINHIKYGIIQNNYPLRRDLGIEACDLAIDTMRKYKKIQEIYERFQKEGSYYHHMAWLDVMEVIEDGKNE